MRCLPSLQSDIHVYKAALLGFKVKLMTGRYDIAFAVVTNLSGFHVGAIVTYFLPSEVNS